MASPVTPPLQRLVRELKSPNHADGLYWVLIGRNSPVFQQNAPIKRGTKLGDLKGFEQRVIDAHTSGLFFSEEIVPLRSSEVGGMPGDEYVIWVFSTDWRAQSSTNAGITYAENSVSHPIYARDYIIRRDAWEASQTITPGTALTALIGVTITGGGTGYTFASGTITGGATVDFVCSGGAIIAGIVTVEGASVTSGGSLTITGDGTGATATAVIQPATALLVAQQKNELPLDSNLSKEFVRVTRIYETLPGPAVVTKSEYDQETGMLVTVTRQKKAVASITPSVVVANSGLANATLTITERADSDGVTAFEVVTVISASPHYDSATALTYQKPIAYTFPARIDIVKLDQYAADGPVIGYQRPYSAITNATVKEWWSISDTAPTLAIDAIIPDTVRINGETYESVLHDAATREYGASVPVFLPATTPDFTTYTSAWVGTLKLIAGNVQPIRYNKIWRVNANYLTMR